MNYIEAMEARHSVRQYLDREIEKEKIEHLAQEIRKCNAESGLHIQLMTGAGEAFSGIKAHFGNFKNVKNYIALVGKKGKNTSEKCGYYGERIVIEATRMGLNTCWVAGSYQKKKCLCELAEGERIYCVIAIGYGENTGKPHKSKPIRKLCRIEGDIIPAWFEKGIRAAQLAPTALNQQRFLFTLTGNTVLAEALPGPYSKIDLGIVKYHFELGAGEAQWEWR